MEKEKIREEIKKRIKNLQKLMKKEGIDGALIIGKVALYYLAHTDQDCHLFIPTDEDPILMVRKDLGRAQNDSPLPNIIELNSLSGLVKIISDSLSINGSVIGLELDIIPVNTYMRYRDILEGCTLVDISPLIRDMRMVKSEYELSLVQKAAQLGDELLEEIPKMIKDVETELDLAALAEAFYRRRGHPGITRMRTFNMESIYGHIISGYAAATQGNSPGPTAGWGVGPFLSHGSSFKKIQSHEPILVDYSSNFMGYISDQTRIFSIGDIDKDLRDIHQKMIMIQNEVAKRGIPGTPASDLYSLAIEMVKEMGLKDGFMGFPKPVPFIGHGVGLELDEWPVIGRNFNIRLKKGMTIALEPKFLIPEKGVVGVENTFVVTEQGMKKLNRFPDDIFIIDH